MEGQYLNLWFDLQHVTEALIGAEIEPVAGITGADVKSNAIIDYVEIRILK